MTRSVDDDWYRTLVAHLLFFGKKKEPIYFVLSCQHIDSQQTKEEEKIVTIQDVLREMQAEIFHKTNDVFAILRSRHSFI
jgi:hypothetical protein